MGRLLRGLRDGSFFFRRGQGLDFRSGSGGVVGRGLRIGNGCGGGLSMAICCIDHIADHLLGRDGLFQLAHLAEGFEGGLHEVSEGADLGVIDGVAGEGLGDGIEIVEDGGVVFHVNEGDEGDGVAGRGRNGLEGVEAAAAVVRVAEVVAGERRHGAAGAAEAEMAAAGVVGRIAGARRVRFHFRSLSVWD